MNKKLLKQILQSKSQDIKTDSSALSSFRANGVCVESSTKPLNDGKRGFTLAETLITLTILGVVAAITIPALINRQQEAANRTKLKKAMAVYEKALNSMIIDYDLNSDGAIAAEFPTTDATCSKTTVYFKKVERDNCRFKTADRVWWDITDIGHTVVMMDDKYKDTPLAELRNLAKDKNNIEVFEFVGGIKDNIVRINDKSAVSDDDAEYLTKLWKFVNSNISTSDDTSNDSCDIICKWNKYYKKPCTSEPLTNCTVDGQVFDDHGNNIMGINDTSNCTSIDTCNVSYYHDYDYENKRSIKYMDCTTIGHCNSSTVRIYKDNAVDLTDAEEKSVYFNCDGEGKHCSECYENMEPIACPSDE